jgi:hypothetical protein
MSYLRTSASYALPNWETAAGAVYSVQKKTLPPLTPAIYKRNLFLPQTQHLWLQQLSTSYRYSWVNLPALVQERIKLKRGQLLLTQTRLLLQRKVAEAETFPNELVESNQDTEAVALLHQLKKVQYVFRRHMLPLILGGTLAPLGIVGVLAFIFTPVQGLILAVAATLLAYLGFRGGWYLELQLHNQTSVRYLTPEHTQQTVAFAAACNALVHKLGIKDKVTSKQSLLAYEATAAPQFAEIVKPLANPSFTSSTKNYVYRSLNEQKFATAHVAENLPVFTAANISLA